MGRLAMMLARLGTVGGTARMAARLYHYWLSNSEDSQLSLEVFAALLIKLRYLDAASGIYSRQYREGMVLMSLLSEGRIQSICHLVVLILVVEAGFANNRSDVQVGFVHVIATELEAKNVPNEIAMGEHDAILAWDMLKTFQPSITNAIQMLAK